MSAISETKPISKSRPSPVFHVGVLSFAGALVGKCSSGQDLQRNVALKPGVMGSINDTHPTLADLLDEAVVGEYLARCNVHKSASLAIS